MTRSDTSTKRRIPALEQRCLLRGEEQTTSPRPVSLGLRLPARTAQQVPLACTGLPDTGMGGREGTDHVGIVPPLSARFGVEHHPLQLLWGVMGTR